MIGSLAAYSLSRFKTGGENLSFWILSTRMFPPVAAALPLFLIFKQLRLLDNHLSLIIANTIFNLPVRHLAAQGLLRRAARRKWRRRR